MSDASSSNANVSPSHSFPIPKSGLSPKLEDMVFGFKCRSECIRFPIANPFIAGGEDPKPLKVLLGGASPNAESCRVFNVDEGLIAGRGSDDERGSIPNRDGMDAAIAPYLAMWEIP